VRRLTVTLLLVVLIAIFGIGVGLDTLFEHYHNDQEDELSPVETFATGLAATLDQSDSPEALIASWPAHGTSKVAIEPTENLPLPATLLPRFESGQSVVLESDEGVSLHYLLENHDKVLSVTTPHATRGPNRTLALVFTSLFYLGTLTLVLLWLKPLLHRLNLLRNTAQSFGAGDLNSRVNRGGLSYIRDIETEFNAMADKIQQLVEDNKLLSSAVSHDLRTPLARLRFGLDTLAETTDPSARARYQQRINNDLNEMESLVNSLLRYARLDNVLEGIEKQPVALRELIRECTAQYYDSGPLIKIDHSRLAADDQLIIHGCIEHLATLFNNLIQNATDHANRKLVIELGRSKNTIEVAFCDDGAGIDEALRETVLKPFQRGDTSQGNNYGLGLAVVNRIAKHHNGRIEIDSCATLGGARISVVFDI
jgi:two-component system OmpR family sensor kinase